MDKLQRYFGLAVMILALAGAQVVLASPLHNHLVHVADCTLCHHDSTESVPLTPLDGASPGGTIPSITFPARQPDTAPLLAFSSRAPPFILS